MLRADLSVILEWVACDSRVLDLGCGDGALLDALIRDRGCQGYGLETSEQYIQRCVERSVPVIQQDLNQGLGNFEDASFDLVVMTQALQVIRDPHLLLDEMLRVGNEAIVTFPNFGHWRNRAYLALRGRMPVSPALPYSWYNTPNIHLCTFKDFESLCSERNIDIKERAVVDSRYREARLVKWFPNLLGETALYRIAKSGQKQG